MRVQRQIVTNVNLGYIPLLLNLRHFLERIDLLKYLHVFSMGQKCFEELNRLGIASTLIDDEFVGDEAIPWATGNWKRMSFQKIRTLSKAIARFGSFLYTDPDVIFQKDVFSFLELLSDKFDIYGQSDYPNHFVCSGFMYIQENASTKKAFSVSWDEYDSTTSIGDQIYINKRKDILRLYSLPQDLFLNGIWFDPSKTRFGIDAELLRNAYIVHYNFTYNIQSKYDRMNQHGHLCPQVGLPHSSIKNEIPYR